MRIALAQGTDCLGFSIARKASEETLGWNSAYERSEGARGLTETTEQYAVHRTVHDHSVVYWVALKEVEGRDHEYEEWTCVRSCVSHRD